MSKATVKVGVSVAALALSALGCSASGRGYFADAGGGRDGSSSVDGGSCSEVRLAYYDATNTIFALLRLKLDSAGRFTDGFNYTGPGPNGQWNDDDDVFASRFHLQYDNAGRLILQAGYTAPGTDGIWGTDDDVQSSAGSFAYDNDSHMTALSSFSGAGSDSMWGTADDVVHARYLNQYQPSGLRVWQLIITGPGADQIWATSDDVVGAASRVDLTTPYDLFHYPSAVYFEPSPGPDMIWGNADDILASLRTFQCTDRILIKDYKDAGPDGMWSTADDDLSGQQTERVLGNSCGYDLCASPIPIG